MQLLESPESQVAFASMGPGKMRVGVERQESMAVLEIVLLNHVVGLMYTWRGGVLKRHLFKMKPYMEFHMEKT